MENQIQYFADGNLNFDTSIDPKGLEKGLKSVESEVGSSAKKVTKNTGSLFDKLKATVSNAFSGIGKDAKNFDKVDSAAKNSKKSIEGVGTAAKTVSRSVEKVGSTARNTGNTVKSAASSAKTSLEGVEKSADKASDKIGQIGDKAKDASAQVNNSSSRMSGALDSSHSKWGKFGEVIQTGLGFLTGSLMSTALENVKKLGESVVESGESFEAAISKYSAISGLYTTDKAADLQDMKTLFEDLASKNPFTSFEVADAATVLAQAGWSPEDIKGSLEDVLNFAIAGDMDMPKAADILVTAMNAYKLDPAVAGNAAHVADVLVTGANSANTSVEQLGSSLTNAANSAGNMQYTLEDTVALLDMFANGGQKAEQAGTELAATFSALTGSMTDDQVAAMQSLGLMDQTVQVEYDDKKIQSTQKSLQIAQSKIKELNAKMADGKEVSESTYLTAQKRVEDLTAELEELQKGETKYLQGQNKLLYNADGSAKTLEETMKTLREAYTNSTMDQFEKQAALETIFQQRAARGMSAYLGGDGTKYDDIIDTIKNKADGSSKTIAGVMADNLKGDKNNFSSAVEGLQNTIYDSGVGDSMRSVYQKATDAVNDMRDTILEGDEDGSAANKIAVKIGTGIANGLLGAIDWWFNNSGDVTLRIVDIILSILLNAVVAVGGKLVSVWLKLCEGLSNTIGSIIVLLGLLGAKIVGAIFEGMISAITGIVSWQLKFCDYLSEVIGNGVMFIANLGVKIVTTLIEGAKSVPGYLSSLGAWIISSIQETFGEKIDAVKNIGSSIMNGIKEGLVNQWEELKNFILELVQKIKDLFNIDWKEIGNNIVDGVIGPVKAARDGLSNIKNGAKEKLSSLKEGAASLFGKMDKKNVQAAAATASKAAQTVNVTTRTQGSTGGNGGNSVDAFRRAMNGMSVKMDGKTVGSVVSPHVDHEMSNSLYRKTRSSN